MAIMSLQSNNPNLSWIIVKNPSSGMSCRSTRQGYSFGWYTKVDTYTLVFKDGLDKMSYTQHPDDFEYLDRGRYASPMSYLNMITDHLRSAWNRPNDKDVGGFTHTVHIQALEVESLSLLNHFKGHLYVDVVVECIHDNVFDVKITSEGTIQSLLNTTMLMCLMLSGDMGYYLSKVNNSFMEKYAGIIQENNLPFFIRYLFARNYFKSSSQFEKYAPLLETESIKLAHGGTPMQRLRAIEKQLDFDKPILDLGCGEGLYALNFPKKMDDTYYAVDTDEELIGSVQRRADSREYDVKTFNSLTSFLESYNGGVIDVICTEVVEHMPLEDAEELISRVRDTVVFDKFILTTPNKTFNSNYNIPEGKFRHDDHDWEMTLEEWSEWVGSIFDLEIGQHLEVYGVGDCVNGEYTTSAVTVSNRNVPKQAVITVGISASGKSTFAEKKVKNGKGKWGEVNRDTVRFDTFCKGKRDWTLYKFSNRNETKVTEICNKQIEKAAEEGLNIICSDTNLNSKYRNRLIDKLEGLGYSVEVREFPITLEDAWKRDSLRSNGVGHTIIARQWDQWQSYLKEKGDVKVYQPDRSKERAVIVDIDGTLAHMTSRGPFEWEKVGDDDVDVLVASVVEGLYLQDYRVILLSGRDSVCREQTEDWLEKHNIPHDRLYMRPEGDFRKDTVVKGEMFWQYVADNYNVKGVIDDRPAVCRMWRDLGLKVLNVGNPWVEF